MFDVVCDHSFILYSVCSTDGGSFLGVEKPKSGRSRQASSRGSSRKKLLANSRPFTPQHTNISADSHASSDRSVGPRRDVTLQVDSLEKHYDIIDTHISWLAPTYTMFPPNSQDRHCPPPPFNVWADSKHASKYRNGNLLVKNSYPKRKELSYRKRCQKKINLKTKGDS